MVFTRVSGSQSEGGTRHNARYFHLNVTPLMLWVFLSFFSMQMRVALRLDDFFSVPPDSVIVRSDACRRTIITGEKDTR